MQNSVVYKISIGFKLCLYKLEQIEVISQMAKNFY